MADLIQLLIKLSGDQEVYKSLEKINALKNDLQKHKINLQIDKNNDIEKEIARVRQLILDLQEKAKAGTITLAEKQDLKDLQSYLAQLRVDAAKSSAEIGEITNGISAATSVQKDLNEAARQQAEAERQAAEEVARMEERFQATLGVVDNIAAALSGVSSIMGGINSFSTGIFDAFGAASNLFSFSLVDKAMDTITSMVTQYLTGNLDRITSRYDIMSTFDQYMALMGVSKESSSKALARINESILGLPIGLDEAAYRLRRYQMFMGDIDQATNFTIGIQRAIMAGGANEQMRNMAYNQIERLLTTGELTNKRQWMSLLNGMGVSVQFIAEELGHADMNGKELAAALYTGNISANEFLDAITSLGVGTSDAAKRLDQALEIYKGTIESWASNIEFAFIRGGQNMLSAINRTLLVETDVSIVGYMEKFRNAVNEAFSEIQKWIDNNPQAFTLNIDALSGLGDTLAKFSAGDIATQAFQYTADFINSISAALQNLDADKTETFIAFAMSIAGPLAAIASVAGDLGVVEGIVLRFSDFDWTDTFTKIVENINNIADITRGVLSIIPDDIMSELLAFGLTYAPLIKGALDAVVTGLEKYKSVISWFHENGGWYTVTGIGLVVGTLAASIHEYNKVADEFINKNGFQSVIDSMATAEKAMANIDTLTTQYEKDIVAIEGQADRAKSLMEKIDQLDKDLEETGDPKTRQALLAAVEELNRLYPEFQANVDATTGLLDTETRALIENKDAYVDAMEAKRKYLTSQNLLESLEAERLSLETELEFLQRKYPDVVSKSANSLTGRALAEFLANGLSPDLMKMILLSPRTDWYESLKANMLSDEERQNIQDVIDKLYDLGIKEDIVRSKMEEYGIVMEEAADKGAKLILTQEEYNQLLSWLQTSGFTKTQAVQAIKDMGMEMQSVTAAAEETISVTQRLSSAFDELKEKAVEDLKDLVAGFEELEAIEPLSVLDLTNRLNENAAIYEGFTKNLTSVSTYMNERLPYLTDVQKAFYKELSQTGFDAADIVAGMASIIDSMNAATDPAQIAAYQQQLDDLMAAYGREQAAIEEAGSGIASMELFPTQDWQNVVAALLEDPTGFGSVSADFAQELLDHINAEIAKYTIEMPKLPEISDEDLGDYQKVVDWLSEVEQARQLLYVPADSEEGTLPLLSYDELLESKKALEETMPDLSNMVETFYAQFAGEDGESVYAALSTVDQTFNTLLEETMPNLDRQAQTTGEAMDTLKDQHVTNLISSLNEADASTNTLKSSVSNLATEMSSKQQMVSDFASTISEVESAASGAASAVADLASAIAGINGASISLDIPSIPSIPSATPSVAPSMFASGGLVDGPYIGRDNIPAMLMPGEFVVRRKAAQLLGKNFLQNLNSMNIPAAVDALMRGVNLPMNHGIVAYDNRRYSDNHATINQNIVTNNPAFTYRRASRFVGAL